VNVARNNVVDASDKVGALLNDYFTKISYRQGNSKIFGGSSQEVIYTL